jgi:hypothetical protein
MNWYIGQEIVCIKSHTKNIVIKGKTYTIRRISPGPCRHSTVILDVGFKTKEGYSSCNKCLVRMKDEQKAYWLSETLFAPIEYDNKSIEELLTEAVTI